MTWVVQVAPPSVEVYVFRLVTLLMSLATATRLSGFVGLTAMLASLWGPVALLTLIVGLRLVTLGARRSSSSSNRGRARRGRRLFPSCLVHRKARSSERYHGRGGGFGMTGVLGSGETADTQQGRATTAKPKTDPRTAGGQPSEHCRVGGESHFTPMRPGYDTSHRGTCNGRMRCSD